MADFTEFYDQNKNHFNFLQLNLFENEPTESDACSRQLSIHMHFDVCSSVLVRIRSAHLFALLQWKKKWWCVNLLALFIRTNELTRKTSEKKTSLNTECVHRSLRYHTRWVRAIGTWCAEDEKKMRKDFLATEKNGTGDENLRKNKLHLHIAKRWAKKIGIVCVVRFAIYRGANAAGYRMTQNEYV